MRTDGQTCRSQQSLFTILQTRLTILFERPKYHTGIILEVLTEFQKLLWLTSTDPFPPLSVALHASKRFPFCFSLDIFQCFLITESLRGCTYAVLTLRHGSAFAYELKCKVLFDTTFLVIYCYIEKFLIAWRSHRAALYIYYVGQLMNFRCYFPLLRSRPLYDNQFVCIVFYITCVEVQAEVPLFLRMSQYLAVKGKGKSLP